MMEYDSIISLGYDCNIATVLKEMNIRDISLPFDWLVTVSTEDLVNCITNDFDLFKNISKNDNNIFVNKYNMIFLHHSQFTIDKFESEFNKKISNFERILSSNKRILLCRKFHGTHEKNEICDSSNNNFEVENMKRLRDFLDDKLPNNNIDILSIFSCKRCDDGIKVKDTENMFYRTIFYEETPNEFNNLFKNEFKKLK